MDKKTKILVICGGTSTEREISLRSGTAVFNALVNSGFKNTEFFDLTSENLNNILTKKPDIAFLALHGKGGEDGTIQGLLELAGIPFTGPGVLCSATCIDKIATKRILESANIPTAKFLTFNKKEINDSNKISNLIQKKMELPVVLKSPCQGSSVGVYIARKATELQEIISNVFNLGDDLLVEEYLDGIEITVPIIGNDNIEVLPIIEIVSKKDFYDYEAKYTNGLFQHIIPARIDAITEEKVIKIAKQSYRLLGCKGLSRIDFIIDKKIGPCVIEVNTLPGMTETSLFPDSAKAKGIPFEKLVEKICELGIEK